MCVVFICVSLCVWCVHPGAVRGMWWWGEEEEELEAGSVMTDILFSKFSLFMDIFHLYIVSFLVHFFLLYFRRFLFLLSLY